MSTPATIPSRRSAPRGVPVCVLALLGVCAMAESGPTSVLFMGADITVEQGRELHPLTNATDTALIVEVGGRAVRIPHDRVRDIRVKDALKLSEKSVGLEGVKIERAYAEGSDPFDGLVRNVAMAAGESAVADLALAARVRADMAVAGAGSRVAAAGNPEDRAGAQAALAQAQGQQQAAEQAMVQALQGSGVNANLAEKQLGAVGEEQFDAVRMVFSVRAERDLHQPYYAVIASIRENGARPGDARRWVYVKPLGTLAAGESRTVRALQGGLPPGYSLESAEVHVYDGGEELATNLSRKRVEVTAEEAQEYRVIEYISGNPGRTRPATLADPVLTAAARAALSPEQARRTWHVQVAKSGRVTAVFLDAAGKQPADAGVGAVMKTLRFMPALAAGKAVDSLCPVTLGGAP